MRERNSAMFNNPLMADITFIVGPGPAPRRVPAHRYVLATGSTVFYAMLYGGLAVSDTDTEEVVVPDVDPDAFLAMLKYLYCDDIQLEPDTVLATLYSAKKYIVPHLARECVRFLETSLTARNACLLLSQARSVANRASNESSQRYHNHGEGPYKGLLLVKSAYKGFHISDTIDS